MHAGKMAGALKRAERSQHVALKDFKEYALGQTRLLAARIGSRALELAQAVQCINNLEISRLAEMAA